MMIYSYIFIFKSQLKHLNLKYRYIDSFIYNPNCQVYFGSIMILYNYKNKWDDIYHDI